MASIINRGNDVTTRLVAMLAAAAMAAGGLVGAAPAANAEPVIQSRAAAAPVLTEVMLDYGYDGTFTGGLVYFSEDVPPSTQLHLTVTACGRVLHTQTFDGVVKVDSVSGDGVLYVQGFQKRIDKSMAPRAIEVSVSFSDPGLAPTSYTAYAHNGYPTSCDNLEPADDDNSGGGVVVQKWSVKKGATTAAKVGKSLGITPTRAPGAKVTYAWKVGNATVDRDRVFFVKKSYKGKKVTVRITVTKPGAKSVSRVLRYGKAR